MGSCDLLEKANLKNFMYFLFKINQMYNTFDIFKPIPKEVRKSSSRTAFGF